MPTSQVGLLGAVAQLHVKRSFTSFPDSLRQLLIVKEHWIIDINVQAAPESPLRGYGFINDSPSRPRRK